MELKENIALLKQVVSRLKTLNNNQFCYTRYVQKFDKENHCGTKCCVAGYYPQWFPEAGLVYSETPFSIGHTIIDEKTGTHFTIRESLCDFHELSDRIIGILFYGEILLHERKDGSKICIYSDNGASLAEVIERFEIVIECLTDGSFTPELAYKSEV